jgi:hypothetical protein
MLASLGSRGSGGPAGRSEAGKDVVDEFAARFILGEDVHLGFALGSVFVKVRARFGGFVLVVTVVVIICIVITCLRAAVAFTADQRLRTEWEFESSDG